MDDHAHGIVEFVSAHIRFVFIELPLRSSIFDLQASLELSIY